MSPTVRAIAVLDLTKEPGAVLLQPEPCVIGGRYGLGSKKFTPVMVKAVFRDLVRER